VQVADIVRDALGPIRDYGYSSSGFYHFIVKEVAHEHGRTSLGAGFDRTDRERLISCFHSEPDILAWLDAVELSMKVIVGQLGRMRDSEREASGIKLSPADAVEELNERFRRAGFGYRFERGQIVRIDSEYLHQQVTIPALQLLSDPRFKGADEEFRAAHDHYKAGEYRDCAVDALNALESTMKAICDAKGWKYEKGARASDLLKVLRGNGLFPDFADQSFEQLVATLKSGLPAVRNQTGGHGQGAQPVDVPEYVATYALNLAAAKIRLLYEAFAARP
jgi:HEPN domain-containing protein